MDELALVEARVDRDIRDRASEVLAEAGMTVSDVTQILLRQIAENGRVPEALLPSDEEYDRWYRAIVQEALDDPRPPIPSEIVEEYFAKRRAGLRPIPPWDDET